MCGDAGVDNLLLRRLRNPNTIQNSREVKRDDILTAPKRHKRHNNDDSQTMQIGLLSRERFPRDAFSRLLERNLDLSDLRHDNRIRRVAVAMILGDDSDCFLPSALRDQPARRLGHPVYEAHDDARNEALQQRWDAPCPVLRDGHVARSEARPGDDDRS